MDIVSLGELLIDMFPAETGKRLTEVSAFIPKPGGAPANVAVAAARLGAASAFIGKVGQDFFGEMLRDVLKREGVETRGMRFDPDARTTLALIAQPTTDNNEYIFYRNPGADQCLRPEELDVELLSRTRALHIGSISLTDEPSRSATFEAVRLAKQNHAYISFDVNYRPALWSSRDDALTQIDAMLPNADLIKVNEGELELLTQTGDLEKGSALLLERGPELVITTLGERGSYYCSKRATGYANAYRVEAIDATGCGDAFMGALLTQLVSHDTQSIDAHLEEAMQFANAAGAITSTRRGAIPAMPTAAEIREFLDGKAE
jgi:fructokinase